MRKNRMKKMSYVIKLNLQIRWKMPVYVRIGNGLREKVASPEAALDYLNHQWAEHQSPEYRRAKRLCLLALSNQASEDGCRQAFVEAAARAKMLA
jgi:Protein of unknown function (DUF982)